MKIRQASAGCDGGGYACVGVEGVRDLEGERRPEARLVAASVASLRALLRLIERFRRTGKLHPVCYEEDAMFWPITLERFNGMVPYGSLGFLADVTDHRHRRAGDAAATPLPFGLIVEAGPYELYLAGSFHLHLVPNSPPEWRKALRFPTVATPPDFLSVEEGTLSDDGEFTARRARNGDEVVFGGFWTAPDVGVVRVRLTPMDDRGATA